MKNKDGLWKLSPSGLYGYTECQSCFWADNHFKKASTLPLLLNTAMDSILKTRFDSYRIDGTFPPEMMELENLGIKPFDDLAKLNEWRENTSALQVIDEKVGYVLTGKIDDVMVEVTTTPTRLRGVNSRLVPADYKSSGNAPSEDKQKYYVDQLAAYGLMFSRHGYEVSDRAYLMHYFVKDKNNGSLEVTFDSHLDLVTINLNIIEKKLAHMVELLNNRYPGDNPECPKCAFYSGRSDLLSSQ